MIFTAVKNISHGHLGESPMSYVPDAGQAVNLSEKIGVNYGGSSSEDYDICHPDNKELFLRAAEVLGDPLVGFDFIISDISLSYKHQKCGFIEVNSLPFINLHHDPLLGAPRNAAALVWDMLGWGG
jgi:D-alanine-D-alanine ligase-like ATP-grasp enzyme